MFSELPLIVCNLDIRIKQIRILVNLSQCTHKKNLSLNDAQSRVKLFVWLNSHFTFTQSRVFLANPRTLLPCFTLYALHAIARRLKTNKENRAIACSFWPANFCECSEISAELLWMHV